MSVWELALWEGPPLSWGVGMWELCTACAGQAKATLPFSAVPGAACHGVRPLCGSSSPDPRALREKMRWSSSPLCTRSPGRAQDPDC